MAPVASLISRQQQPGRNHRIEPSNLGDRRSSSIAEIHQSARAELVTHDFHVRRKTVDDRIVLTVLMLAKLARPTILHLKRMMAGNLEIRICEEENRFLKSMYSELAQ